MQANLITAARKMVDCWFASWWFTIPNRYAMDFWFLVPEKEKLWRPDQMTNPYCKSMDKKNWNTEALDYY